jgi:hypothetical protein
MTRRGLHQEVTRRRQPDYWTAVSQTCRFNILCSSYLLTTFERHIIHFISPFSYYEIIFNRHVHEPPRVSDCLIRPFSYVRPWLNQQEKVERK